MLPKRGKTGRGILLEVDRGREKYRKYLPITHAGAVTKLTHIINGLIILSDCFIAMGGFVIYLAWDASYFLFIDVHLKYIDKRHLAEYMRN